MKRKNKIILFLFFVLFAHGAFADLLDGDDEKGMQIQIREKSHLPANNPDRADPPIERKKNKAVKTKKDDSVDLNSKKEKQTKSNKSPKSKAPVHFTGMGLTALKSKGVVELHKEVVVTQEDFRLESDEAKIFLEQNSDEVKKVSAEGRVRVRKTDEVSGKLVKANGDLAEFDNLSQEITLKGNAKIVKGEDLLTGNVIHYNLKTGWIKVEKVKGVVTP